MTTDENLYFHSDLVKINNLGETTPITIYAHQLNQYYHTLLGNPFQRRKFYDSLTKEYYFYRTPGIINYIITYYLHHGSLLINVHFPPEILYDELVYFGFNIQVIYDIISNIIAIDYYIPSGKYRRAFWYIFNTERSQNKYPVFQIVNGLVILCSVVTSFILVEIENILSIDTIDGLSSLITQVLIAEILLFIFVIIKLIINYIIRPKLKTTTMFFIIINLCSFIPVTLFLFIWTLPPTWLYILFVIQYVARLFRCLCLSSRAYQIVYELTNHLRIYFEIFQLIIFIVNFFSLLTFSFDQISSTVDFLHTQQFNSTKNLQIFSDFVWISINAYTSLGEGSSRPSTIMGLATEFLTCFIGILTIPHLSQNIYTIVLNTIDKQNLIDEKRKRTHLARIQDEFEHKAIAQVNVNQYGMSSLPEILIQKDEF